MKLLTNISRIGFVLLALASVLGGCSKMDDTYKQFLEGGTKVYIGKIDSVFVYPGNYRVQLGWLPPTDPKAITARVYWNNRLDSVDVPIMRSEDNDTIKVVLDNLTERTYVFEVFTFDNHGRRSLMKEVVAKVYGDEYKSMLLSKPIDGYTMDEEDNLTITWGAVPDTTVYGTEIRYEDRAGDEKTLFIPRDELMSYIEDFPPQIMEFRTVYRPSPLAIDLYYTDYVPLRIKGQPVELSKAGWTAETSSFDDRSGSNYRPGSKAIDEDPSTIWVNKTTAPTNVYPHTITVDMKSVQQNLDGFAIITRVGDAAARPKTVELYTSIDGENWTSHFVIDLANSGDRQIIEFNEPIAAQYFRMIATSSYSGGNIALAEIGMFRW